MKQLPRLLTSNLLSPRLLGSAAPSNSTTPTGPLYSLGSPGRPSPEPTLVIPIFDNSGSVISPAGNDPLSNRFAEVERAFSVVAKKSARHELGAVLHFDVPTSADVAPVPLTRAGLVRLRAGLHVPPDGAGTSRLGPSLSRARQLAAAHPNHRATLVVLSDFLLLDSDVGAVLAELATFPGTVHAVVLGGRAVRFPADRITVTTIKRDDPPGAVAKALFASLTRHRPGSRAYRAASTNTKTRRANSRNSSHIPQHNHAAIATAKDRSR